MSLLSALRSSGINGLIWGAQVPHLAAAALRPDTEGTPSSSPAGRYGSTNPARRVAARLAEHELTKLVIVSFEPLHLLVHRIARDVGNPPGMTRMGSPEWVSTDWIIRLVDRLVPS